MVPAPKGPALVHAHVIRPYSHSLSDDEIFTSHRASVKKSQTRPCDGVPEAADRRGRCERLRSMAIKAQVEEKSRWPPTWRSLLRNPSPRRASWVYSPDGRSSSEQFDTEDECRIAGGAHLVFSCLHDRSTFGASIRGMSSSSGVELLRRRIRVGRIHPLKRRLGLGCGESERHVGAPWISSSTCALIASISASVATPSSISCFGNASQGRVWLLLHARAVACKGSRRPRVSASTGVSVR